jgi:hypothetical protein
MIVRTLPLNLRSARADGSLLSRRGDARRAAGQCLVALAFSAALAACGAQQSSNPLPADEPLAETAGQPAIRAADCSATGTVANLPANDDFLAVRTGPGTNYSEVARLGAGVAMHLCTPAKDSRWVGVVYRPDGELPDAERCGLSTDKAPQYEGPCRFGWVSARYIARNETELAVGDSALAGEDKLAAVDRLNDKLNEKFPTSKNLSGFFVNYMSLGVGCKGYLKSETYQDGKIDKIADFDYSDLVKISKIYESEYANPKVFEISIYIAPDANGSPRVKASFSKENYDIITSEAMELAFRTRESAEEAGEILLQLRSMCRAIKRKEQASMDIDQHRPGRNASPRFAIVRHHGGRG